MLGVQVGIEVEMSFKEFKEYTFRTETETN